MPNIFTELNIIENILGMKLILELIQRKGNHKRIVAYTNISLVGTRNK